MENNFEQAFEELMILEGGYVNNPNDPGGETNFGISKRSYPDEDIKNLNLERAREIYYKDYWLPNHYDQIKDNSLAAYIFHNSVNCGVARSHLLLQRAFRACHILPNCDVMTFNKEINFIDLLNQLEENNSISLALKSESAAFRRAITVSNPQTLVFEKGWMKRSYNEIIPRVNHLYPQEIELEKTLNLNLEGIEKEIWDKGNYLSLTSNDLAEKLFKTSLNFYQKGKELNESLDQTSLILQRTLRAAGLLPQDIREEKGLIDNLTSYANKIKGSYLLPSFRAELAGFYRIELLKEQKLSDKILLEEMMQKAYDDEVFIKM
jgi:hypothetical protein